MLDISLEPTCFQKKKTAGQVFHLLTSPLLTLKGSSSWLVDLWSNSTTLSLSLSTPPPPQIGRSSPGAAKAKEARRRKENSQNQKTRILCFVSKVLFVVVHDGAGSLPACLKVKPAGRARGFTTQNRHKTGFTDHYL